ncbi:MAG TPA: hypothetical protein VLD58_08440 [Gemmatimonadales bacterium]|nr:hypothetical protein [Gemmatimonadales bacterium]
MPDNLPARRIDRGAIERIIQRATELQTGERDIADGLTPDEVVALGKEVGIPERYLQQAMLEERSRTGPPPPVGILDKTIGPGTIRGERVVRGAQDEVEQRLVRYFDEHELLTVQRQQPGRISWEPLRGVQGALRRSSAVFQGNRPFMLAKASLVSVTVVPLEPGFSHVALAAELRASRGAILGGASAIGGISLVSAAILYVMSPFILLAAAPLPLGAAASWAILRQYRGLADRTQLGLERALDHLERGEPKPTHALPGRSGGVLGAILDEVRKAMQPPRP